MSEQREPDQTEDPRGQDVGDGYPEVQPDGDEETPGEQPDDEE
jgi:hypothetical protein